MSRAIGDLEYKKNTELKPHEQLIIAVPDVTKHTIKSSDEFILMGCDGIYETLSNQELIDYCRERLIYNKSPHIFWKAYKKDYWPKGHYS